MGKELQDALHQFDSRKPSSEDLRQIIDIIKRLVPESENSSFTEQDLQEKIEVEKKEVKKAKERLQGLTDSSRDGGPVKVGETEDELWKQFELHRSSAMDEIIDQKSPEGSLTQEQSDGLRGIADSALEVCCQQYEEQQTKLCAALMLDTKRKLAAEKQSLSTVRCAASTFQTELQYEIVPFLMEKLCQKLSSDASNINSKVRTKNSKDEWIINFDKTKDIRIKGSGCEKFMKSSLEVCWKLQNRYKDVKFYWDIKEKPELFKQCAGSPQEPGKVGRVYIPAVCEDKESLIRKGKYSFEPSNPDSNTREGNDTSGNNTYENADDTRATSVEGKATSSGVGSAGKNEPSQRYPPRGRVVGSDPLISLPHTEENGGTTNKGNPRPHKDKPSAGSGTVDSRKNQNLDF
uniref:Uncharacterized protein LOC111124835 isoform X1 n=1 Tax=Crassostrea virginica TaxID=6565 RepID=A0A8B8D813_CRAVI|nr:uncharacterized protein LOC111124835 isoform X1 [Crassostrea virginica]XP_022323756.1 uncharacterized protein LOC111124835 isoform X1 [Crassostrea virginica]